MGKRMAAKLKEMLAELRQRMHGSPKEIWKWLAQVVPGISTSRVRTVCDNSASTDLCGVVSRMREKRNAVPDQTTVSCCRPMMVANVTEEA